MQHPVAHEQNGVLIFVDLIRSPAAKRIAEQPQLLRFAQEILRGQQLAGTMLTLECNLQRQVGTSQIIATAANDTIFYARLTKDDLYTRFVKTNKPQPTQVVTMRLQKHDAGYELHDIWFGLPYPPRPGSSDETAESEEFWQSHAFVYESQPLQASSITKICPY